MKQTGKTSNNQRLIHFDSLNASFVDVKDTLDKQLTDVLESVFTLSWRSKN